MVHAKRIILFFCCAIFLSSRASGHSWTVFMYIDSSDALSDMAIKNLTDAALANVPAHVTVAVQLHAFGTTAYRYVIKNNALVPVQTVELGGSSVHNFVAGAQWAFGAYPADKTMILFGDHGYGILEPQWNPLTQKFEHEPDVKSSAN